MKSQYQQQTKKATHVWSKEQGYVSPANKLKTKIKSSPVQLWFQISSKGEQRWSQANLPGKELLNCAAATSGQALSLYSVGDSTQKRPYPHDLSNWTCSCCRRQSFKYFVPRPCRALKEFLVKKNKRVVWPLLLAWASSQADVSVECLDPCSKKVYIWVNLDGQMTSKEHILYSRGEQTSGLRNLLLCWNRSLELVI